MALFSSSCPKNGNFKLFNIAIYLFNFMTGKHSKIAAVRLGMHANVNYVSVTVLEPLISYAEHSFSYS